MSRALRRRDSAAEGAGAGHQAEMRQRSRCARSVGVALALSGVVALAADCGGSSGGTDTSRGNVILSDANNYRTTATLDVHSVDTAPMTDLDICWTAVAKDLECHGLVPQDDIDNVALLRIGHLSHSDVETRLADGQLAQSQVEGYLDYHADHTSTCAKFSQLSFLGTQIDIPMKYVENDNYTYMLLFTKGTTPGTGARSMIFLHPTSASTNTKVDAESGCGLLSFSADLKSLTKARVTAAGPWVVDWRDITRDGNGNPPPLNRIDGVTIGFYENLTPEDLQTKIFDLELIATSLWDIKLSGGKTADLALAKDRKTGDAFGGFTTKSSGTWVLALTCSACQTPAPVLLTVLDPSGGA